MLEFQVLSWDVHKKCGGIKPVYEISILPILRSKLSVYRHCQQYFNNIVAVRFIGGGNWRTQRRPTTCRKSLTNFFPFQIIKMGRVEIS
jgi:hypothetical protein